MLTEQAIREIAADLASLETALAGQGMSPQRITAILAGAAGTVIEGVTGQLRQADWSARQDARWHAALKEAGL